METRKEIHWKFWVRICTRIIPYLMYVYIYIHVYIYVYMHIYIYTRIHILKAQFDIAMPWAAPRGQDGHHEGLGAEVQVACSSAAEKTGLLPRPPACTYISSLYIYTQIDV